MNQPRFDGRTGRPLVPLTPEKHREHVRGVLEANRRWLREQVWWRRTGRVLVGRLRVLMHWGTR